MPNPPNNERTQRMMISSPVDVTVAISMVVNWFIIYTNIYLIPRSFKTRNVLINVGTSLLTEWDERGSLHIMSTPVKISWGYKWCVHFDIYVA